MAESVLATAALLCTLDVVDPALASAGQVTFSLWAQETTAHGRAGKASPCAVLLEAVLAELCLCLAALAAALVTCTRDSF